MEKIQPAVVRKIRGGAEAAKLLREAVQNEDDLRGFHFIDSEIAICPTGSIDFYDCLFEGCRFVKNEAEKPAFVDVCFTDCDLSNLNLSGAVFQRVGIERCRATGLTLANTLANHVSIRDTVCRYLNLNASDWRGVLFENTDCSNAGIQECRLKAVEFIRCNLTGTDFFRTRLGGIDFTTDELQGIAVSGDELKGAVVTPFQACELARLLGVVIRPSSD